MALFEPEMSRRISEHVDRIHQSGRRSKILEVGAVSEICLGIILESSELTTSENRYVFGYSHPLGLSLIQLSFICSLRPLDHL